MALQAACKTRSGAVNDSAIRVTAELYLALSEASCMKRVGVQEPCRAG